jgi:hypothetical protein
MFELWSDACRAAYPAKSHGSAGFRQCAVASTVFRFLKQDGIDGLEERG